MCNRIRQIVAPAHSSACGGRDIFIAAMVLMSGWIAFAPAANLTWDNHLSGSGDGITWDNGIGGASQNWISGSTPAAFTQGSLVVFNDSNHGNYFVNLASNVLPGSVTVNSTGNYVFDSAEGFCIADYLSPTTLVQSGGGMLTIANFNTFTGPTTVSGSGTRLYLESTGALATSQLSVNSGASTTIDGLLTGAPAAFVGGVITFGAADDDNDPAAGYFAQSLSSLSIASTGKVSLATSTDTTRGSVIVTNNLSILGSGQLDLSNNDLIIPYSGSSPSGSIRAYLHSGFNNGAWNGSGIVSSAALINAGRQIGYGEAADLGLMTFDEQAISGNALILKYTYAGDSTLDGTVDLGNDFNLFLQGFLTGASDWEHGDYNYDGRVDMADFQMFIDGYSAQGHSLGELTSVVENSPLSANQKAELLATIPEPPSVILGVAIACGVTSFCLRGSRRRHKGRLYC